MPRRLGLPLALLLTFGCARAPEAARPDATPDAPARVTDPFQQARPQQQQPAAPTADVPPAAPAPAVPSEQAPADGKATIPPPAHRAGLHIRPGPDPLAKVPPPEEVALRARFERLGASQQWPIEGLLRVWRSTGDAGAVRAWIDAQLATLPDLRARQAALAWLDGLPGGARPADPEPPPAEADGNDLFPEAAGAGAPPAK